MRSCLRTNRVAADMCGRAARRRSSDDIEVPFIGHGHVSLLLNGDGHRASSACLQCPVCVRVCVCYLSR